MKKILFAVLLFSKLVTAQSTDTLATLSDVRSLGGGTVDYTQVGNMITTALNDFSTRIDSVVKKTRTTANATLTAIDTLDVANNSVAVFDLSVTALSGTAIGVGRKVVTVKNMGGTLSIVKTTNVVPYFGETGVNTCNWFVDVVNGRLVVRVKGKAGSVEWELARYKAL